MAATKATSTRLPGHSGKERREPLFLQQLQCVVSTYLALGTPWPESRMPHLPRWEAQQMATGYLKPWLRARGAGTRLGAETGRGADDGDTNQLGHWCLQGAD